MRVYEYSKQYGISNKDIIKILQEGGFKIQNHMSVLTPESINFLESKIKKNNEQAKQPKSISLESISLEKEEQEKLKIEKPLKVETKREIESSKIIKPPEIKPIPEKIEKNKIVLKSMTLGELADNLNLSASELILSLLKKGLVYNKNQMLPEELIEQLAKQYEIEVIKEKIKKSYELESYTTIKIGKKLKKRLPIVVVMGHVDHGKTSLLDFIRKSRVASKEKGGITQHLGAYQVETKQGGIVFLDTPGHEAFSMMRMRGARVADIVILVVAVDDGVMPQTVEAIKVAQSKNIPIIVALNKIDRVDAARIEEVKGQLAKYDLLSEDWGGQTICVLISAKLGQGIDQLLDMIILQSEVMELSADENINACGYILESKFEKGLGPVATFIAQHGILKIGDFFICGNTAGKVTILIDSNGKRINQAGPSLPVLISGFQDLPGVGEYLQVVSIEEFKKSKIENYEKKKSINIKSGSEDAINIILKTDNESSKEAILNTIEQISKKNKKEIIIVNSGVGNITEGDITLACNTNSIIYGFNVKSESSVNSLASQNSISIRLFDIIYKLFDDIQEVIKSKEEVQVKKVKTGEAVVRKIFDIKGVGVIAGVYVKDGKIVRNGKAIIWRGNKKISEGEIKSLQREKKAMKEISAGFEGAFLIENYKDWEIEDRVECFIDIPVS